MTLPSDFSHFDSLLQNLLRRTIVVENTTRRPELPYRLFWLSGGNDHVEYRESEEARGQYAWCKNKCILTN